MMKKIVLFLILILSLSLFGCFGNRGEVGDIDPPATGSSGGSDMTEDKALPVNNVNNVQEQEDNGPGEQTEATTTEPEEKVPEPSKEEYLCNVLDAATIKEVCGKDVSLSKGDTSGNMLCSTNIIGDDPEKILTVSYSDVGQPADMQKQQCINNLNGEDLGGNVCFAPEMENTLYVFKEDYTIIISHLFNTEDKFICSVEQLKELGQRIGN